MGYPIIARAITSMVPQEVLLRKNAVWIARKAGLRPEAGGATFLPTRIRTIVEAWIIPDERPLLYQWRVDLSGFESIRLTSQSSNLVTILYSTADSTDIDPGDYSSWGELTTRGDFEQTGEDLFWTPIPEDRRTEVRLALVRSATNPSISTANYDGPFAMGLQGF